MPSFSVTTPVPSPKAVLNHAEYLPFSSIGRLILITLDNTESNVAKRRSVSTIESHGYEAVSSGLKETFQTKNRYCFQLTIGIAMAGHQDARYIPPRRKGDSSRRRGGCTFVVRWLAPAVIIIVAVAAATLSFWRGQTDYSDEQRACIAQRYSQFDARKLSQCVDVCKACMKGSTATCNMSCWLKLSRGCCSVSQSISFVLRGKWSGGVAGGLLFGKGLVRRISLRSPILKI